MRKTLLIALMTGSLALGAVSTYAGKTVLPEGKILEKVDKSKAIYPLGDSVQTKTEKRRPISSPECNVAQPPAQCTLGP